jgi:hypothetical protein
MQIISTIERVIGSGFNWAGAPVVLLLIVGGLLLSTEVGRRLRLQRLRVATEEIWTMSVEAIDHASSPPVAALILAPLNATFDIVTTRSAATQIHPPAVVWVMLGGLTLACSVLAGYEMGIGVGRHWLHALMFASIFSLTLYVIIDMEFPRVGFVRVDAMDSVLQAVRDSMR